MNEFGGSVAKAQFAAERHMAQERRAAEWADKWAVTVEDGKGGTREVAVRAKSAAEAKAKAEGVLRRVRVRGVRPAPITVLDAALVDRNLTEPGWEETGSEPGTLDRIIGAFRAIGGR